MSILYTHLLNILGDVFGYKNHFHGLAVLLDTYNNHNGAHNHQHPYISAMINNGTLAYDHDRDGTHTELAGCSVTARNVNHETFIAVRYLDNKLSVGSSVVYVIYTYTLLRELFMSRYLLRARSCLL